MGFTPTPGIPVFVVDTNGKTVGGGGLDQAGNPTTGNNNGQNAEWVPMQMCTCSAGVKNATYGGSGRIRLRGGNNSGVLVFCCMLCITACLCTLCEAKLLRLPDPSKHLLLLQTGIAAAAAAAAAAAEDAPAGLISFVQQLVLSISLPQSAYATCVADG